MSDNFIAVNNGTIQDELELLFEEAVDLGNCLKRKARHTHQGEKLSASGRILLENLRLNGSQTVPALAFTRSTSRQNIQTLVDRLEALGHVEFVANPDHARSDLVRLTPTGEAMLRDANEREAAALTALLPHTTETEVRSAAELLRKLRLLMTGYRRRVRNKPAVAAIATPMPEPLESEDGLPVNLL